MSRELCVLELPLQIIEFVDRARRHCLWRKSEDRNEKSYSLAAWDLVCQLKKKGGLGITDLKVQNQGLLMKFLHKFYHKAGANASPCYVSFFPHSHPTVPVHRL
jgi:hypothetical protein